MKLPKKKKIWTLEQVFMSKKNGNEKYKKTLNGKSKQFSLVTSRRRQNREEWRQALLAAMTLKAE